MITNNVNKIRIDIRFKYEARQDLKLKGIYKKINFLILGCVSIVLTLLGYYDTKRHFEIKLSKGYHRAKI